MSPTLIIMLAVIFLTLAGDYFLKLAALNIEAPVRPLFAGIAFYAVSSLAIVIAMRQMTLASFGVWYSVLTILAMTAMGVVLFGERLTPREMLGIGFALASLACMSRLA